MYLYTGSTWTPLSTGSSLTFADSIVNTGGTVTLVNDTATPGNSQYYGTNSGGTLGYYALATSVPLPTNEILIGSAGGVATAQTMSGDATIVANGTLTLVTVNTDTGSFGSSTAIPSFTVNGKGLITAASTSAVVAPAGTLTGTTLASNVVTSSLTTVGTIGTGTWQGTTIAVGYGGTGTSTAPTQYGTIYASTASTYASTFTLFDSSGVASVALSGRQLQDSAATPQLSWATTGVKFNQLTASTVPYLNASSILTSSAVTPTQLGYLSGASGTTGTGSLVFSASPTLTGTLTTAAISASGALNMNSNQINNLAMAGSPAGTDATNVTYVQGQIATAINGLTWKGPVQAYSTSNVPLSGSPSTNTLTIDGYSVQNGDYVILSNQTTASQNNVYVASGIGGTFYTLSLAPSSELTTAIGDAYLVENGTVWANSAVQANAISPNNTYIQFAGPNFYTFTSPLLLTGTTVTVGYDNSTIGVNGSNQLYVKANGITYTQFQQVAASSLVGNPTGGTANAQGITLGATLTFVSSALQTLALTGDVTTSANSFATTVSKIQGTSITGTTGTGNVVLSAGPTLTGTITAASANFSGALGANGGITSTGALAIDANSGASAINLESSAVTRGANNTSVVTETYVDSTTLTDNSGPTAVTAFQFATASFTGEQITYTIKTGTATADVRIGTLSVVCNASGTQVTSLTDQFTESADCGVSWTASVSSGTVSVSYTTTSQGSNRTMRADVKSYRA